MQILSKNDLCSTLWIFVTFNYLYCDLIGLMDANLLRQYLTGTVNGLEMSEHFLLYAGMLMEVPIVMILLSRLLPDSWNAGANLLAGLLKTTVMVITLFMAPSSYYYFFASIEIATTLFITLYATHWLLQLKAAPFQLIIKLD